MESVGEIVVGAAVEVVLCTVAAGALYLTWGKVFGVPKRIKVLPFQSAVVLDGERVVRRVAAGTYWVWPKHTLLACDMRPKPFFVQGLELLTADGRGVRISLSGEYKVGDSERFLTQSSDAFGALYIEVRQAVKTTVAEVSSEELLASDSIIANRVTELATPKASQLGLELGPIAVSEFVPLGWFRQV